MATNVDLYKPDGDKSLYVSPLQYRPKLSDSSALKDSTKLEDMQKQLSIIYDKAKTKSQLIINHVMKIKLSKLEEKNVQFYKQPGRK